jgi:hypothetical protein
MGDDSRQRGTYYGCIGAVATHEPVRSEEPDVSYPADRVDWSVGYVIGIRQALMLRN